MLNILLRRLSSLKVERTSGYCMKIPRKSLNGYSSKPYTSPLKPSSCPLHLQSPFAPHATSDYCLPFIPCLITAPTSNPSEKSSQPQPSYDFCYTPCPLPPLRRSFITYILPICNICNRPYVPCMPPCCSLFNPPYGCEPSYCYESPYCYANYGLCYNPYYPGCPCGQACANCAGAYPPCFAKPFAPPVCSQSDSAKLSPSVACLTRTSKKHSNTTKKDSMASSKCENHDTNSDYPLNYE